jgi:uncharacterized membrane protein YagU involved in acid resistance
MATVTKAQPQNQAMALDAQVGVVAGLVGGSVFGVQMAVGGMLPMVAGMIGSESVVIGFLLHLFISAFIGGTFGLIASRLPQSLLPQVAAGFVYGLVWWVLGALIIMPLVLGMGDMVLQIGDSQLMSFVGHGIFGIVMGVSFVLLHKLETA